MAHHRQGPGLQLTWVSDAPAAPAVNFQLNVQLNFQLSEVLALDWFFIFLDLTMSNVEEDTDAALPPCLWQRYGYVFHHCLHIARSRGLKVLRILRLVRLAKLFPKFHSAFIVVQSDFIRLSMGAWFAVVIVVVMNHYVACAWFALGKSFRCFQGVFREGRTCVTLIGSPPT
ncbi:unnamed protein product [Cladocopium goreaui]|uniref:Potassium voltage-gated channel subfamily H member 5 n=1 Tax=Cladocopium goreaui TaxID=2562237 RepID=A0A9P1D1H7_9DINO|nr:unnamed protein product [Cladocopium goreaui]